MSKLVKSREDPTVVLELADEAFHQMPLSIPVAVILPLLFRALMRWNHHFRSTPNHHLDQLLPSVASIPNHPLEAQPCQQCWSMRAVVALPCRQMQTQRIAQPIHQGHEATGRIHSLGATTSSDG